MSKKGFYLVAILILIVFIVLGWFQYFRFLELKEKTLYYDKNNFQRIYYYIRYHLFQEAHKGGVDLLKVDIKDVENYNFEEPLKIIENIKQQNLVAEKVLLAKSNYKYKSIELFYFDSLLVPVKQTKENKLIITALNSFKSLILTGDSFGEDYSVRLDNNHILLVEPIINKTKNEVLGFLGIIINSDFVANNVLPLIFDNYNFPEDSTKYIVRVVDYPSKRVLYSNSKSNNQNHKNPDFSLPIAFVFNKWMIEIFLKGSSIEDMAFLGFYQNIGVTALVLVALLIGFALIIRTAQKEQQLSQMKSDFIANISHELKTPLSVIQVAGENLKNNKISGDNRLKQYGDFIFTETQRLVRLVDKILNFVHIESGNYIYNFKETDINKIIQNVFNSFAIQFRKLEFQTKLELDNSVPKIKLDEILFREVIQNLIDNAIKYSNLKKEITIASHIHEHEIIISIADKGIGISKSDQKYIFDKFFRGGTADIHNTKGSGLGLSFVKQVVKDHNGWITVLSEPEKGSRFTIHLKID